MAEPSAAEVAEARRRADSDRPPALHLDVSPEDPHTVKGPAHSDMPLWTTVALGLVLIAGVIAYSLL